MRSTESVSISVLLNHPHHQETFPCLHMEKARVKEMYGLEEKGNLVFMVRRKFPVWLCVVVDMMTEPTATARQDGPLMLYSLYQIRTCMIDPIGGERAWAPGRVYNWGRTVGGPILVTYLRL